MQLNESSYWAKTGFAPCWNMTRCDGILPNGDNCPAFNMGYDIPCWQVVGTRCKGKTGRDATVCATCVVYRRCGAEEPLGMLYNVVTDPHGQVIQPLEGNRHGLGKRILRGVAFVVGLLAIGTGALVVDPALSGAAHVRPDLPIGGAMAGLGLVLAVVPLVVMLRERKDRAAVEDMRRGMAMIQEASAHRAVPEDAAPAQTDKNAASPRDPENNRTEAGTVAEPSASETAEAVPVTSTAALTVIRTTDAHAARAGTADNTQTVWTADEVPQCAEEDQNREEDRTDKRAEEIASSATATEENAAVPPEPEAEPVGADDRATVRADGAFIIGGGVPKSDGGPVVRDLDEIRRRMRQSAPAAVRRPTFADVASLFDLMTQAALTDRKLAANLSDGYSSIAEAAGGLAENAATLAAGAARAREAVENVLSLAQSLAHSATELSVKAGQVAEDMQEAAELRTGMTGDAAKAALIASEHVQSMAEDLKQLVAGLGFGSSFAPAYTPSGEGQGAQGESFIGISFPASSAQGAS